MTQTSPSPLDRLPRVALAHLPTPVEPLPRLSAALDGPQLWIKRDDQTGLATGGNKTRKLEFLMAQVLDAEADTVITAGSTQSNHARQTAAAAAKCGLACHLVLYAPGGTAPTPIGGNVLLDALLGATIHWTDERAPYTRMLAQVERALRRSGCRPYLIPYGGSSPHGLLGYADAMRECAAQIAPLGGVDAHVFATSSGGTQAGLLLGAHLTGQPLTSVLGISVDRAAPDLARDVVELATRAAALLGHAWTLDPADVRIDDAYCHAGYAVITDAEREAIRLLARHEGILVDPVYTGRALAGLIDLIRRGAFARDQRVLFWHTGGATALFAFADALV